MSTCRVSTLSRSEGQEFARTGPPVITTDLLAQTPIPRARVPHLGRRSLPRRLPGYELQLSSGFVAFAPQVWKTLGD